NTKHPTRVRLAADILVNCPKILNKKELAEKRISLPHDVFQTLKNKMFDQLLFCKLELTCWSDFRDDASECDIVPLRRISRKYYLGSSNRESLCKKSIATETESTAKLVMSQF